MRQDGSERADTREAPLEQNGAAQDFWLDALGESDNFNRQVFRAFAPWLSGRVLELGCGTGNFTRLIAEAGHSVTAVDINPAYVAVAGERLASYPRVTVAEMDIREMALSETFDTVILLDVLEHIEDDVGLLRDLAARLAPGGRLILKVPAMPSLYCPMDRAIGHYRRYDRRLLEARLAEAGLAPVETGTVNALGILGWWLNGRVLGRQTPPRAQVGLFDRVVPVAGAIERGLRLPIGLSLMSLSGKVE